MAVCKSKTKRKQIRGCADLLKRVELFFDSIAPHLVQRLTTAEARANHAEAELKFLQDKLVGLLNAAQIEHAHIAGITPQLYAIECIELYKEKFFPQFEPELRPLAALRES